MYKTAVLVALLIAVPVASAQMIPSDIDIDIDLNIFGGSENSTSEEENSTYGERVGGQSVYTETKSNNPPERRNSEEYGIREDSSQDEGILDSISKAIGDFFG